MYKNASKWPKLRTTQATQLALFFLLTININTDIFAESLPISRAVNFEKNPILISDSLKKTDAKLLVTSSLDKLSENIYFSAFNTHFFLTKSFGRRLWTDTDFLEILALNEFYRGSSTEAEQILTTVFETTTDSGQKVKTCLNLIKISYLNNHSAKSMSFLKIAKDSLGKFFSSKEKYGLILMEAKIALTLGQTTRAEHLIIESALPMSSKVKGKYNEFNCYLLLGKIYLKAKQLTQAKWFFIQANTIAVNQNYVDGKIETSLLLAKTKIKVGDKAVALQDLEKARRLIDGKHQIYLADLNELTRLARR